MLKVADDYMIRMGIVNTQFVIARHFDKEHPAYSYCLQQDR